MHAEPPGGILTQYSENPNGVLSEVPRDDSLAGGALAAVKGMFLFRLS